MDTKGFSTPINLKHVRITDAFWHREQELVRTEVIPYQWDALNDRVAGAAPSYCMHNFKAAGRLLKKKRSGGGSYVEPEYTFRGFEALPEDPAHPDEDKFYGFVFQDTDFSKWIEAVAYSLTQHPDEALERTADEAIDIVCAAQLENGYLDTYYIINGMDKAFTNLRDHHELYCLGHLVEGAVAYYEATGKEKLLRAACRFADYVADYFGEEDGKCKGYPGHEIAEMALARLYEVTGEEKYLTLGRFFLHQRGREPFYFDSEDQTRAAYDGKPYKPNTDPLRYAYHQAHMPVTMQGEAVGHAVRAGYLYSGMADVARLTGDEKMYAACERLWNNIVSEKLYVTGGIGGTHIGESFSYPYDLPNDTAYSETCAAIGLAFFARRMLEIKADSRYADVMEQALYNTVLAGMALDGKSFFYVNPLEVVPEACHKDLRLSHVKPVRQKWFGCACCPPNIARIVSSLAAYAYTENQDTLYFHLYMGSVVTKKVGDAELTVTTETKMPWEGSVHIRLQAAAPVRCTLALRIPGWCDKEQMKVSAGDMRIRGEESEGAAQRKKQTSPKLAGWEVRAGYLYLDGEWQDGDQIFLDFPMRVHMLMANTKVREDMGKVAFTRGPVTYCMEEADNGKNLHLCSVDLEKTGQRCEGVSVCDYDGLGHPMKVLKVPGLRVADMGEKQNIDASERANGNVNGSANANGEAERNTYVEKDALYHDYEPPKKERTELTFVLYYAWSNRGEGEMSVWVRC